MPTCHVAIIGDRSGAGVLGGLCGGEAGGVSGPEVRAVPTEDLDPESAGIGKALGDQMGRVVLATASHADIGRCRPGVLADSEVGLGNGVALGGVHGGGVGELDVSPGVGGSTTRSAEPVVRCR